MGKAFERRSKESRKKHKLIREDRKISKFRTSPDEFLDYKQQYRSA